jgi:hypothetical protein
MRCWIISILNKRWSASVTRGVAGGYSYLKSRAFERFALLEIAKQANELRAEG